MEMTSTSGGVGRGRTSFWLEVVAGVVVGLGKERGGGGMWLVVGVEGSGCCWGGFRGDLLLLLLCISVVAISLPPRAGQ